MDGSGPFGCPICLEALREPVTLPCGHNFCLACLSALWPHRGAGGAGVPGGAARCPLCQEPFPDGLQLRKNHTLSELLQLRQGSGPGPGPGRASAPAPAPEPAPPSAPPSAPEPSAPCAPEPWTADEEPVRCDACPEGAALPAALSCLSCLASFCPAHLAPHERSPALRGHRLVPPLRRLEESLCPRHLRPLERYCRAERLCLCEACAAQEHRGHELVPLEQERALQEVGRSAGRGGRAGGPGSPPAPILPILFMVSCELRTLGRCPLQPWQGLPLVAGTFRSRGAGLAGDPVRTGKGRGRAGRALEAHAGPGAAGIRVRPCGSWAADSRSATSPCGPGLKLRPARRQRARMGVAGGGRAAAGAHRPLCPAARGQRWDHVRAVLPAASAPGFLWPPARSWRFGPGIFRLSSLSRPDS